MQHKAGLHYKTTEFNWRYWIALQRFGCFNSAPRFFSLIKQTNWSTKQLCSPLYSAHKFSELSKSTLANKLINTSANLEGHHQRQQPFPFPSFVHQCNVMDPIDVHVLMSPTRQWLHQCKQEGLWSQPIPIFNLTFQQVSFPTSPLKLETKKCAFATLACTINKIYTQKRKPEHYLLPNSEQTQKLWQ